MLVKTILALRPGDNAPPDAEYLGTEEINGVRHYIYEATMRIETKATQE